MSSFERDSVNASTVWLPSSASGFESDSGNSFQPLYRQLCCSKIEQAAKRLGQLQPGDRREAFCTQIESDRVWFFVNSLDLAYFQEQLQNVVEAERPSSTAEGSLLLARWAEDGKVYRAKVEDKFINDFFSVRYVDYGNSCQVSLIDLHPWLPALDSAPFQAFSCKWEDIGNSSATGRPSEKEKKMLLTAAMEANNLLNIRIISIDPLKVAMINDEGMNTDSPNPGSELSANLSYLSIHLQNKIRTWMEKADFSVSAESDHEGLATTVPPELMDSLGDLEVTEAAELWGVGQGPSILNIVDWLIPEYLVENDTKEFYFLASAWTDAASEFYVHPILDIDPDTIDSEISKKVRGLSLKHASHAPVGSCWAYRLRAQHRWLRARVVGNLGSGSISLLDIDFGQTYHNVQVRDLYCMPEGRLRTTPGLAIKCSLARIQVVEGCLEKSRDLLTKFFENDVECAGIVIGEKDWELEVAVYRVEDNASLGCQLVKEGLATSDLFPLNLTPETVMGVDEEEEAEWDIQTWEPIHMEYEDPANNYATADDDVELACHGHRPEKEQCSRYQLLGFCPRGQFCPLAATHCSPAYRHAALTDEAVDVENPVRLPTTYTPPHLVPVEVWEPELGGGPHMFMFRILESWNGFSSHITREEMAKELQKDFDSFGMGFNSMPSLGQMLAFKDKTLGVVRVRHVDTQDYEEEDDCYRFAEGVVKVYLVDYGLTKNVALTSLRILPPKYLHTPDMARRGHILNLVPAEGDRWSKHASRYFFYCVRTCQENLYAKILPADEMDVEGLHLQLVMNETTFNIKAILQKAGFAA